ncbi:glycosyltransferase [Rehaibacterium terrae]|uniref:GT2 family glycosyltransferase n=1 Tax=Rehaibacterium terrae TaxID=1341696 RepID=A0A7W7V768_9GAMM|nr:GT2 family glycosyltransferase [Rehaibacterium terrae]
MNAALPTVVVPVFNAVAALDACLAALDRTLPAGAKVHVCDDASTDPRVADVLDGWRARTRLDARIVRRECNLGFTANVNLAFAETAPDDVVLLNSDTLPTRGWLQRLAECAASDPRIATATPWSNNAEIASFPRFIEPNPVPDDPDRIADAAASAGAPEYPELPTAVGFCMYVRRAALDQCGAFDAATFGRGYGEENDFSLRVAGLGWRNVLCDNAYVVHLGNASFGPLGEWPGGENLRRLNARWPGYNERIARYILADPLRPLRDRLQRRLDTMDHPAGQRDLFDP